jgi:copper homeostasis protein CutC
MHLLINCKINRILTSVGEDEAVNGTLEMHPAGAITGPSNCGILFSSSDIPLGVCVPLG